jgi:hypothetical protein
MNPRFRKTVSKAMIKKRGTTAIAKKLQKKKHSVNPTAIRDDKFRAVYDKEKTMLENMRSVDLKTLYNDSLPVSIPSKAAWTLPKLNEEEVSVVRKLISLHGEGGFKKMACDRKHNKYQWTEEQCQKKVNLLVNENRVHICEDGKCLCAYTQNSSYVPKRDRIRK